MFLTISDQDRPDTPSERHFRVLVLLPECVQRLVRRLLRRRVS